MTDRKKITFTPLQQRIYDWMANHYDEPLTLERAKGLVYEKGSPPKNWKERVNAVMRDLSMRSYIVPGPKVIRTSSLGRGNKAVYQLEKGTRKWTRN